MHKGTPWTQGPGGCDKMTTMPGTTESFVDLTYRGLQLGRRVKLTAVRPSTGYLEIPMPMPVGTAIAILTDDTVALEAVVVEIHEQVGGSERAPGMVVKPKLEAEAAKKWWQARVALPELEKQATRMIPQPPVVATTVQPKRTSRDTQVFSAIPEVLEEGQDTAVMEAVMPDAPSRPSNPDLQDDGKSTTMMDAVDLAALGLDASTSGRFAAASTTKPMPAVTTAQMPAVDADEDEADDKKPSTGGTKKKRKKR
ncbi:MAG: hypothetical protein JWO36_2339 [Myxococcales bacterium]|nr:hypothetical protein [Myxococcales bacterium]